MICPRCKIELKEGEVLVNNFTSSADFYGDEPSDGVTMSPDGTAKKMLCLKCPECGHSRSFDEEEE